MSDILDPKDADPPPPDGGSLPDGGPPPGGASHADGEDDGGTRAAERDCRERAVRAEALASELAARLAETEEELRGTRAALAASERRRDVDGALLSAGAIDLETARALAERHMEESPGAEATRVVESLRERKPFLFSAATVRGAGVMGARATGWSETDELALEAVRTGDRGALLRYLKAKRAE